MKRIILSLSGLLMCGILCAQEDKQNAVVNVENDYNPVMVPVKKKSIVPNKEKKDNKKPLELEFSKGSSPFHGFTSERDVKDLMPGQEDTYNGYARIGAGNANSIDLKAAYNMNIDKWSSFGVLASINGFNTNIDGLFEGTRWRSRMYGTIIDAGYTRKLKGFDLGITGGFDNQVFNYQLTNPTPFFTDKQNSTSMRVKADITSQLAGPFSYKAYAGIGYNNRSYSIGIGNNISEARMNIGGNVALELTSDIIRNIGADIDAGFYLYNSNLRNGADRYKNIMSFDFNPYTNILYNNWKIRAGLKLNFKSQGKTAVAFSPDITAEGMITDNIGLYAEIKGGRMYCGFEAMNMITPYWNYDATSSCQLEPTYKVVDILLSARFSHFDPIKIETYGGYTYTKDDILQFVGNMYYDFIYVNLAQHDTRNTFIGAKATYSIGGWFNLAGDLRFDSWHAKNKDLLIMKPFITMNISAEARPIKELVLRAGYNFTQYTKGKTVGRLDDKNDLYARASYHFNKKFSAYLQGNNLLDNGYYDYAGYEARGINCIVGATMNF